MKNFGVQICAALLLAAANAALAHRTSSPLKCRAVLVTADNFKRAEPTFTSPVS